MKRPNAIAEAVRRYSSDIDGFPNYEFRDLLGYDFLSCFCPLDQPCHIDAIIAEGAARGIWTPGDTT